MPFIIREHPTHLTPINGVAFAVHEAGSISAEVGDELAELFLSVPLFRLAEENELPEGLKPAPVKDEPPKETAAQKKVREKAEKEAAAKILQEAQEKADAEAEEQRLAQEKADAEAEEARLAEEKAAEEAAEKEAAEKAGAGDKTQSADNVF